MKDSAKKLKVRVHGYGVTNIGGRKSNQDSFFCNDKLKFYLVADGIGGHSGGDVASLFTSEKMNSILQELLDRGEPDPSLSPAELEDLDESSGYHEGTIEEDFFPIMVEGERILRHVLWFTNEELRRLSKERADEIMEERGIDLENETERKRLKMGTTLIGAWIRENKIIIMNVGDSRAYIIWEDKLQRLTQDHSKVEDVIREGDLSPQEARKQHKRNVITRCVGIHEKVEADFYTRPINPGMRILLCSDGLYDVLPEEVMLEHCTLPDIKSACNELINSARSTGEELVGQGKKKSFDNITAVLIDIGGYTAHSEDEISIDEDSIF